VMRQGRWTCAESAGVALPVPALFQRLQRSSSALLYSLLHLPPSGTGGTIAHRRSPRSPRSFRGQELRARPNEECAYEGVQQL
jgi:hypothetical protein